MEKVYDLGEIVVGKVNSIQPYGAFLEFENGSHGLLHISEISSGFVRRVENFVKIGELVKVKVIGIEEASNFLKVSIKKLGERERQVIRKSVLPHHRKNRVHVTNNPEDFEALKSKIPGWIDDALKEE